MAASGTTSTSTPTNGERLRASVRARYGTIAASIAEATQKASCGSSCCETAADDPITADLYDETQLTDLPTGAVRASLGCGNPTALIDLREGETALDLGSGGGIDVLLSAKRVGPTGFAYGLNMTDEMLTLAEQNRQRAGAENVQFLKGTIEQIPLPDNSVDVIISNCVINLSVDKDAVLREAFRVLEPGERFAVSDMVVTRDLPESVQESMEAWAGCIAGALHQRDDLAKLTDAGFAQPEVQIARTFGLSDLDASDDGGDGGSCCGPPVNEGVSQADLDAAEGALASAFIRATKTVAV